MRLESAKVGSTPQPCSKLSLNTPFYGKLHRVKLIFDDLYQLSTPYQLTPFYGKDKNNVKKKQNKKSAI